MRPALVLQEDCAFTRTTDIDRTRPAIFDEKGVYDFELLEKDVCDLVKQLIVRGLRPGHRVAIILRPGRTMLALLIASLRYGLLVTTLSSALGPAARRFRLESFRPDWIVDNEHQLSDEGVIDGLGDPRDQGGRLVLWTSGSTGMPSGVVLTWQGIHWNARTNAAALGLTKEDRTLVLLDCNYCYALVHQIFSHFITRAAIVLPSQPIWLESIGRHVERWRATTLAVVPSILKTLLERPRILGSLEALRMITIGGAAVDEYLLEQAQSALPKVKLVVTYGLTEAGPRVCTRFYGGGGENQGLVGLPLPGVDIDIARDGELLVRSPSGRVGLLADGEIVPAPEWVATGDFARIEPSGEVRILGRKKKMIDRGGVKLSPGEIEQVIRECVGVEDVRVAAVPHLRLGQVPKAYVLPRPGAAPSPSALARSCFERLGAPWVPVTFEIVAELPSNEGSWKEAR